MGKIIDVAQVQAELDRAARDARHGPRDVRAGRFVHRDARDGPAPAGPRDKPSREHPPSSSVPGHKGRQPR